MVAIAIGSFFNALGNGSIAAGQGTTANGGASLALGYYTTAISRYSMAAGYKTVAKAWNSFVIGSANDTSDAPTVNSWEMSDRIFQIGNGFDNLRSNALTVLRNGNTGIGVLNPAYRLEVAGRMRIRSGGSGT